MQAYIPEFILAGLAMLLLLAETFCKKTPKFIFGLIGAAGTLAMLPFYMEGLYDNIYIILALVATAVTLLLSVDFRAVINLSSNDSKSQDGTGILHPAPAGLRRHHLPVQGIQPSGTVRLPGSAHPSSFIMVGYFRRNLGSTEAGIKYLILGAVSTGFLVFGLAWYFGVTGTFIYDGAIVSHALAGQTAPAMYLALAMLLLGTAFKIGAVPMQLWIPDVYQGAPTPVTAFLSVASKVAGFALLNIILAPFAALPPVEFVVALMAAATLLVGNLGAIPQTNLKRMMGYSSIAQAGFILPLFIGTVDGQLAPNAPFYLAVYLVMTFGAFFALAMIRIQRGSEKPRSAVWAKPIRLALAVTIMFASLAGVPLTAGFFAKMISFVHVINTGLYLDWMLPS
ncbi:MAG: NADH-quinone oxidoreductase subunit N [Akkermansia sp.]